MRNAEIQKYKVMFNLYFEISGFESPGIIKLKWAEMFEWIHTRDTRKY